MSAEHFDEVKIMNQKPENVIRRANQRKTKMAELNFGEVGSLLCHLLSDVVTGSFTVDVRQPWTNYVNNGNKYLIIETVVRSEHSNISYLHLIIGNAQKFVLGDKIVSEGRNHVSIVTTNLLYFIL